MLGCAALVAAPLVMSAAPPAANAPNGERAIVAQRVQSLTRDTTWTLAGKVSVAFTTHHPQGMVKIGDVFYVSSVEVRVPPKRLAARDGAYDRDTGEGTGHLFKISSTGQLLADVPLGEGAIYHPGGIDYDGVHIWVPVAEYRPNGRSMVYRVSPETMTATKAFTFDDHLGGIVHDTAARALHGVSWGSRRFYRWALDGSGRVKNVETSPERLRRLNPSHYVDFQDCKSVALERMLCTGVTTIRRPGDASPFGLGGVELIDLKTGRPIHQTPVLLWTSGGLPMTQNPSWFEPGPDGAGLRAYFMPEDNTSTIYIYDADTRKPQGSAPLLVDLKDDVAGPER